MMTAMTHTDDSSGERRRHNRANGFIRVLGRIATAGRTFFEAAGHALFRGP